MVKLVDKMDVAGIIKTAFAFNDINPLHVL